MSSRPVKLVDCHPEVSEPTVTAATATSRVVATTDINLVAAATSLIPALRSRSSETDALARLPDATIADLEKAQPVRHARPKEVWRTAMLSENLHGCGGRTRTRRRFCGVGVCYRLGQHLDGGNALFKAGCRRNIFRRKFPHGRCARPAKVENKTRR